jgi:hypothetical protein
LGKRTRLRGGEDQRIKGRGVCVEAKKGRRWGGCLSGFESGRIKGVSSRRRVLELGDGAGEDGDGRAGDGVGGGNERMYQVNVGVVKLDECWVGVVLDTCWDFESAWIEREETSDKWGQSTRSRDNINKPSIRSFHPANSGQTNKTKTA